MRGTPIKSSGASCEPSSETHSIPTEAAKLSTSADLPMPGGPQINTGRVGATLRSSLVSSEGVTVNTEPLSPKSKRVVKHYSPASKRAWMSNTKPGSSGEQSTVVGF